MIVSRQWLEAFLRRPLDRADLVPRLAMLGLPPDLVESLGTALKPVVVGQVAALVAHPNADRLHVCQVDIGGGQRRQVVTGASNVALGAKYPFAPIGVTLPNGLTLEKRKLRGEVSEGMLCSPDEIGLGTEHDGLMTLTTDASPGTPIPVVLGLDDDRLTLDISPMRGDLLAHKGVARELAAGLGVPLRLPDIPGAVGLDSARIRRIEGERGQLRTGLVVRIAPGASCQRFTAAVIDGIRVGPSPQWLRQRLESVGQRSINNVVDVTNYVMLELGQPLHGYDGAALRGDLLEARPAVPGERITTLDGADRALPVAVTVVADAGGVVGVAGIMGGQASEVTEQTTTLVLEAAWWDPGPIRRARKLLGMVTEASQRFERGVDIMGVPDALRRAVEITLAVAGGSLVDAIDVGPKPPHPPRIFLRRARVNQIIGLDLPMATVEQTLVAIGCTVLAKPEDDRLAVDVPSWRRDLTAEIDLVEEVARIYGYDRLPDQIRPFRPGLQTDAPSEILASDLRGAMAAEGLFEVALLPIGPGPGSVRVVNPLTADHGFLRDRLIPGLIRQVEANWANQIRDVRLFEIGTAFAPANGDPRPIETTRLAGVLTGGRTPAHWTGRGRSDDVDWWDLKGLFERAVSLANPGALVQVESNALTAVRPDGTAVGWATLETADAPPWAAPLFGFEVIADPGLRSQPGFVAPPSVPAALRDLSFVMPWSISAAQAIDQVRRVGGSMLESVQVVDEYRGEGLPSGTRSVAMRLTFRGQDRTLKDTEVDHAVGRIRATLEKQLGVTLRS